MNKNCTVLLVEDNPDDVCLVELAFERAQPGHHLSIVNDGTEAWEYLNGRGQYSDRAKFPMPKFILLDLGMPGTGGLELLKRLRMDPELSQLPVTVFSGSSYLRNVSEAYRLGANSFLVKPCSFSQLTEAIRETVDFWLSEVRGQPPACLQVAPQIHCGSAMEGL